MIWYPCGDCCSPPPPECPCTAPDGTPSTVTLTAAGIADGTALELGLYVCQACSTYNGANVLGSSGEGTCCWYKTTSACCLCSGLIYNVNYRITVCLKTLSSGNLGWEAKFTITANPGTMVVTYEYDSGGTADLDCTSEFTLDYIGQTGPNLCTSFPSTVQLN